MNSRLKLPILLKPTILWTLHKANPHFSQSLLLCCFVVCLTAMTGFILCNANSTDAKNRAMLSIYDDNSTPGMINVDGIYADAINMDRQVNVDTALVKEQVKYEQLKFEEKLADLEFVLQQYTMMELQAFKFVIDMPKRQQVTTVMLTHLQDMLTDFSVLNPDIRANWLIDPDNAQQLIVHLHTERQRHWGRAGFMI